MAGSHRAPRAGGRVPGWAVAVAVVVALVPATWFGARALLDGSSADDRPSAASTSRRPIPPVSPSTTPPPPPPPTPPASTPPPSPSATPTPTHSATSRLVHLPGSTPRRLVIGGLVDTGFDAAVEAADGELSAASVDEVARWASRGRPGSPGSDTVVVVGRVLAGGAFEGLPRVRPGAKVVVRTDEGELTYTVTSVARRADAGLLATPTLRQRVPGRLVLLGTTYGSTGSRLPTSVVVVAQLSAVEAG